MPHRCADQPPPIHRRQRSRLRTCLPARLVTLEASLPATLLDLSLTGARLQLGQGGLRPATLRPQEPVILHWGPYDQFGTLVWRTGDFAGVEFDAHIAAADLVATRDLQDSYTSRGGQRHDVARHAQAWVEGRI